MRVALKGVAATLILAAPISRVRAELVIGTVVDVNMMETEKQDFEEGWAEWRETINKEILRCLVDSDKLLDILDIVHSEVNGGAKLLTFEQNLEVPV